jgi:hypothetical protein
VPEQVLYDRTRTMFSREDAEAGQIVFNHTLLEFAPPTSKTASASSYHPIALDTPDKTVLASVRLLNVMALAVLALSCNLRSPGRRSCLLPSLRSLSALISRSIKLAMSIRACRLA